MEPLIWPGMLPQMPVRSGYTREFGNNSLRAQMEYGPAKTRRRSSAQPQTIKAEYLLREKPSVAGNDVNQKSLFEAFYHEVDCTGSFWLPNPEDGTQFILVRIKPASEDSGVRMSVVAPFIWKVELSLEVHPLVPPKPRSAA